MTDSTYLLYSNPVLEGLAPQTNYVLLYASEDRIECYLTLEDALADQATSGGTLMKFLKAHEFASTAVAVAVPKKSKAKRGTKKVK
jgi:hypothetical protein